MSDGRKAVRVGGRLEVQDSMWPDIVLAGGQTIQERFEAFHQANPWVFTALEQMVTDDLNLGLPVGGMRMYWEVLRWRYNRRVDRRDGGFRCNDHFPSRYARALVEAHPEWASYFNLRVIRAA